MIQKIKIHTIKVLPIPIILSIVMLLMTTLKHLPHGFYTLLRLVVCLTSIFVASFAYKARLRYWTYLMGLIALLFNPIIKVYFNKSTWQLIDLVTAIIFVISIAKLKRMEK